MQPAYNNTSDDSNALRTHFTNKLGVYSPEDQTVTWTADNGIRIVSYLKGRGNTLVYPQYEKGKYLETMITLAKKAMERGEGILSQTLISGAKPLSQTFHWHVFFDPRLTPIVTEFTRYPQVEGSVLKVEFNPELENDLSTPFNSSLSKQMVHKVGLFLSSFGLPPQSYAVLHESIRGYFSTLKPNYNEWAEFADEKYFKPWAEKNEFIEGHTSFSSMSWATVSKFILGVSEAEFVDHAHIWNTLFHKNWNTLWETLKGSGQHLYALMCIPKMEAYVLKKIRETQEKFDKNEELPESIIYYWIKNNTAEEVLKALPASDLKQACEIAKSRNITIEEMFYLDNFFGVMIGMQENIAFVLTQIARRFAQDGALATVCKDNMADCKKLVGDVLRTMPPAGISRELRWDTDIVDVQKDLTYSANKGDQFITMPALTMHLEEFNQSHINSRAFSDGPHKCPGQVPALGWLAALTHELAQYEFRKEDQKEPDYYLSFILRDGGMKFIMSQPGHMAEKLFSEEDELFTIMF